jgi:cell fate regulator YaaT (PSP1 superfamily)
MERISAAGRRGSIRIGVVGMPDTTPPRDEAPAADQRSADPSPFPAGPEEPGASIPDDIAPPDSPTGSQVAAPPYDLPPGRAIVARYGVLRSVGLFQHDLEGPIRPGTKVVVRSERGLELAEVLTNVTDSAEPGGLTHQQMIDFLRSAGPEYPLYRNGRVLRLANAQDLIDQRHLTASAREETLYCRKEIRELKLDMKLVSVEHLLGGERIIFYFAAENRVDFRELVRRLAAQFRTRIEMRQVGARDEARLVGDFERCGRPCCCQSFLKDLKPISMRMAKTQKATLDPSKISGRCGRLMCCLRYEDACYEELRTRLPSRNSYVRTASGVVGKVIDMQILTQLVHLQLADNSQVVVSNEEIKERDVPPPPPAAPQEAAERPQPTAGWSSQADPSRSFQAPPAQAEPLEEAPVAQTPQPPAEPTAGETPFLQRADETQGPRRRRRRQRRGGRQAEGRPAPPGQGQVQPPAPAQGQAPGIAGSGQSGGGRRRRRHRRRR